MILRQIKSRRNFHCSSILKPDLLTRKQTLLHQIKKCSLMKELEHVYATMIKVNATQDCLLMNQFISRSSTFFNLDYAVLAFTQMDNPNVFVYNALIKSFLYCGHPFQAFHCYIHMFAAQILPTSYTFSSLIKACASISASRFGRSVHGHVWKNGFESNVFVQTGLIDFYSSLGGINDSQKVFDAMPERDVFAWTTMVLAHAQVGDMSSAQKLFEVMPERNTVTWNTMIDGYARSGNVNLAESFFKLMPKRDIISWTTMITCYSKNRQFNEALEVFSNMKSNGFIPDKVTMATVISSCAHLGILELGKEIHLYVTNQGFDLDVYIGSALVDMYAKCGSLEKSLLVFLKLRDKNLFCWNSVIEGLAAHGHAEKALMMFEKMEKENIKPNGITFISILSACTHAGLVEEGKRRFLSMSRDYSILPQVEHYGCMVDMLSKAGLVGDALEVIKSMKYESNSVIWGALLSGCKLHRNLDIARVAVEELMKLEPNHSGHFNLLINIYAEENLWGEVANMRGIMKELGVEKNCPGSSWIELEQKICRFSASSSSHPDSNEIYLLLEELDGQMKLAGYEPEIISSIL